MFYSREFSILFWFNRNLALPESDSQNLEFIADSEALLKISDKSVSNHALKNNSARKLRCLIQSFYQSLIKKRIIMLKKQSKKSIYGNTLVVPLVVFFMLFQVNVVAQKKRKETTLNITGIGTSNHFNSTEKELNAEKIFFKKSII
jgi:beta-lactamase regulating signal transducer with metallopeptidase domain